MLGLKKPTNVEQVLFADAQKFVANGYAVSFVPFGLAQPQGPWPIRNYHDDQREEFPSYGVSILLAKSPNSQFDFDKARASWLVAVTVRTENKLIAATVDTLIAARRRWREGVTSRDAVVRGTTGSRKALYVFALDPSPVGHWLGVRYPFEGRQSRKYRVPKTPGYSSVEVRSAASQFVHSGLDTDEAPYGTGNDPNGAPYFWRGVDLTQVQSSALPIIDEAGADALVRDIETVFEANAAEWAV